MPVVMTLNFTDTLRLKDSDRGHFVKNFLSQPN